ncbi:MAG: tRNA lysidine(34) synthetase TilS [Phycisphaerales bacterium]
MPNRRGSAVRRVVSEWRRLTGGGASVVVACSGGADSSALVLALGAGMGVGGGAHRLRVVTVRHHDRARSVTDGEIERVRGVCGLVGAEFEALEMDAGVERSEGAMRRARYALLEDAAVRAGIGFVATGHQADDQLESMLLALVRGAGVDGLRGIARRRRIVRGSTVRLIRPMLGITRAEAEAICAEAGWAYAVDATNADVRRARGAVRALVVPELERVRPGVALRAGRTARVLRDASAVMEDRARSVLAVALERDADGEGGGDGTVRLGRGVLAAERGGVVGCALRVLMGEMVGASGRGRDGWTARSVGAVVRAVRDGSTEPRRFAMRGGVEVVVRARVVELRVVEGAGGDCA